MCVCTCGVSTIQNLVHVTCMLLASSYMHVIVMYILLRQHACCCISVITYVVYVHAKIIVI